MNLPKLWTADGAYWSAVMFSMANLISLPYDLLPSKKNCLHQWQCIWRKKESPSYQLPFAISSYCTNTRLFFSLSPIFPSKIQLNVVCLSTGKFPKSLRNNRHWLTQCNVTLLKFSVDILFGFAGVFFIENRFRWKGVRIRRIHNRNARFFFLMKSLII